MRNLLGLCVILLGASCVSSGQLQRIADQMADMEVVLADETSTTEDIQAALKATTAVVDEVADEVAADTKDFIGQVTSKEGLLNLGITAALTFLGVNGYRNRARRKRGEPVALPPAG